MNDNQKIFLGLMLFVFIAMILFPPFVITIKGSGVSCGYSFILIKPEKFSRVDVVVLLIQWLFAITISFIGFIVMKNKK